MRFLALVVCWKTRENKKWMDSSGKEWSPQCKNLHQTLGWLVEKRSKQQEHLEDRNRRLLGGSHKGIWTSPKRNVNESIDWRGWIGDRVMGWSWKRAVQVTLEPAQWEISSRVLQRSSALIDVSHDVGLGLCWLFKIGRCSGFHLGHRFDLV